MVDTDRAGIRYIKEIDMTDIDFMMIINKSQELKAKHKGIKESVKDTTDCPQCGEVMDYSVASSNMHVHAACRTEGCISWME